MKWPYLLLTAAYCAGIFWISAQPDPPINVNEFPGEDKLLHAAAYGGLALIVSVGLRRSQNNIAPALQFWVPLLFAALYGVSDEIHQNFVPGRHCDVGDILADAGGALILQWLLCYRIWFRSNP